jgi:hypothetical protein
MLAGPSGTGKTQIVNGMLSIFDPLEFLSCNINFNFYTTSAVLQSTISIPLGMICLYICINIYVCVCICMCLYLSIYMYIYTCVYKYEYIYIYIHT